jgi:hypothetical protein
MFDCTTIPAITEGYRVPEVDTTQYVPGTRIPADDARVLRAMAGKFSTQTIADTLGWAHSTTRARARKLGISLDTRRYGQPRWESWREDYLRRYHLVLTYPEIAINLGYKHQTVCRKAANMGLTVGCRAARQWGADELGYLRANHTYHTCAELGELMGIDPEAVYRQLKKMGLAIKSAHDTRTEELRQMIMEHGLPLLISGFKVTEVAERLGLAPATMYKYLPVDYLDYKSGKRRLLKPWTTADERFLTEHYNRMSVMELAFKMGRTRQSIRVRASVLGLRRGQR